MKRYAIVSENWVDFEAKANSYLRDGYRVEHSHFAGLVVPPTAVTKGYTEWRYFAVLVKGDEPIEKGTRE